MVMLSSLDKAIVRLRHQGTIDFDVFETRGSTLSKSEDSPKNGLIIPSCCECPDSSSLQERFFLPTFHLDTANGRPACANGGVVGPTPPVRTSAQVVARFRRQFRCPPPCQRAGLVLAQLRVPAPQDSLTLPHSSEKTPPLASGTGSQMSDKDSLSTGAWRLEEGPEVASGHFFKDLRGTSCVTGFCICIS